MGEIKIITDSTSDLPESIIEKYNIDVVPLRIIINKEEYYDGIDINADKLFYLVDKYDEIPKTAAPSPIIYKKIFEKYINQNKKVLYIGLSAEISSCINNAQLAAQKFPNTEIEIIDSKNLSTGIAYQVINAAKYRRDGLDLSTIKERLKQDRKRIKTRFIPDSLDFLHKGGRCSSVSKFLSSMLKVKPMIEVKKGKMGVSEKIRGGKNKVYKSLLDKVIKDKDQLDNSKIFVTEAQDIKGALYLKDKIEEMELFEEIHFAKAGGIISSHCGPNTVGLIYAVE
ncbi:MAG: DegV family protein [Bacillota bacterium]